MIYFSQHEIDHILLEDTPLHDETSRALGLADTLGKIEIRAREHGIVCGLRITEKMARSLETSEAYAQTGVDLLITSSPYHAKPADFGAKITPLYNP